jgi:hypothetical protein
MKNVTVEPRPSDCDFIHAPLGDKGCHYKKMPIFQKAYIYGGVQYPPSVEVTWEKVSD